MAEERDDAQKTEDPTQKRLQDALRKGDVARSQEVRHWFMLVAAAIVFASFAGWVAGLVRDDLGGIIANADQLPVTGDGVLALARDLMIDMGKALGLPLLFFFAAGLGGALVQHRPIFTTEKIVPKLNKISLIKGLKRLFSPSSLMEFAKTVFKFIIVGAVTIIIVWPEKESLPNLIDMTTQDMLAVVQSLIMRIFIGVVATMTIIAVIDFGFQRFQHHKKMRMTKQEVRDEHKQLEGDPHVKARIRQIRTERARRRMMAAVPESDVVITNPTHYAVALKYDYNTMDVPVVTAKGVDELARRIREVAEENDVPLVENPPLARALHATVEVDERIPAEHFKAVAEVIGFVMRLRGERIRPRQGA